MARVAWDAYGCLGMTYDDWDDKKTLGMTCMTRDD